MNIHQSVLPSDSEGGRSVEESAGKSVEVVCACIEKRRRIYGQESDGDPPPSPGKRRRGRLT